MLKIVNLSVEVDQKQVLKDINLEIKAGEIHVLLGPNGSGKSSLAQVIMGNPRYRVTQGQIFFKGEDITQFKTEERVKLGLALSFQDPPAINGVKLKDLLKMIARDEVAQPEELKASDKLLNRFVNQNFSGGEKKIAEMLQILSLNPELVVFDELDSGLDLKNLDRILQVIKKRLLAQDVPVLFITHHGQITQGLEPDMTHVMLNHQLVCHSQDYQQVINSIKAYGYQKCRQCQSLDR